MLKTEQNMDDYAAKMMAFTQANRDQLQKATYEKQKEGESIVEGYFMHYTDFDKGQNRMITTDQVPAGLSKKTSKGGMMYLKNFEVILSSITPNDDVTYQPQNNMYTINASIRVDNKGQAATLQYLRDNQLDKYYDFERDCVKKSISVQVAPNLPYPCTIMAFSEQDINVLSRKDTKTDQLKIRKGKAVKLDGAKFQVRLRTYQRNKNTEGEEEEKETVMIDAFEIVCSKVQLSDSNQSANNGNESMSDLFHRIYPKDTQFLYDIKDVLENPDVQIPQKVYIYTSATKQFAPDSKKVIRLTDAIKNRGDALYGFDNDQYETKVQASFFCNDIYPDKQQTFTLNFTAYAETCEETGLDTGDQDLWGDLLMAHPLSAHFVCQYSEKSTMNLICNHPQAVAFRDQVEAEYITHGTYKFTVKQWIMDWEDTLLNRGIEITKETFLDTFKDANKGLASGEKKFKVATVDGQDELVFISVLSKTNPIVTNGDQTKVINFGSGKRPTFSSQDAGPIINRQGARFFALTGVPKETTAEWSTPEEGAKVFLDQVNEHNVKYQLFVIQSDDQDSSSQEKVKK